MLPLGAHVTTAKMGKLAISLLCIANLSSTLLQVKMVYDIFLHSGVLEFFKIEERKIMAFIAAVCSHYHKNPYHNFCHVVYVLHTTYMMIMRSQVAKSLNRVDQLVLLIAALCHDVDHDGEPHHCSLPLGGTCAQTCWLAEACKALRLLRL